MKEKTTAAFRDRTGISGPSLSLTLFRSSDAQTRTIGIFSIIARSIGALCVFQNQSRPLLPVFSLHRQLRTTKSTPVSLDRRAQAIERPITHETTSDGFSSRLFLPLLHDCMIAGAVCRVLPTFSRAPRLQNRFPTREMIRDNNCHPSSNRWQF